MRAGRRAQRHALGQLVIAAESPTQALLVSKVYIKISSTSGIFGRKLAQQVFILLNLLALCGTIAGQAVQLSRVGQGV